MLRLPREHGLIALWLAALIYALLQLRSYAWLVILTIIGSVFVLLSSDPILTCIVKWKFKDCMANILIIILIYLPLLLYRFNYILPLLLLALLLNALLVYFTRKGKVITHYTTTIGSGIISIHSSLILISGGIIAIERLILPIIYSMMATAQASIKVLGFKKDINAIFTMLLIFMVFIGLFILSVNPLAFYVILTDISSRILQEISGLSEKISIKAYGIMELLRSITILGLLGYFIY